MTREEYDLLKKQADAKAHTDEEFEKEVTDRVVKNTNLCIKWVSVLIANALKRNSLTHLDSASEFMEAYNNGQYKESLEVCRDLIDDLVECKAECKANEAAITYRTNKLIEFCCMPWYKKIFASTDFAKHFV